MLTWVEDRINRFSLLRWLGLHSSVVTQIVRCIWEEKTICVCYGCKSATLFMDDADPQPRCYAIHIVCIWSCKINLTERCLCLHDWVHAVECLDCVWHHLEHVRRTNLSAWCTVLLDCQWSLVLLHAPWLWSSGMGILLELFPPWIAETTSEVGKDWLSLGKL